MEATNHAPIDHPGEYQVIEERDLNHYTVTGWTIVESYLANFDTPSGHAPKVSIRFLVMRSHDTKCAELQDEVNAANNLYTEKYREVETLEHQLSQSLKAVGSVNKRLEDSAAREHKLFDERSAFEKKCRKLEKDMGKVREAIGGNAWAKAVGDYDA